MKTLIVSIPLLFAAGCAMQSVSVGDPMRYECYTKFDRQHVLTLSVPKTDAETPFVEIIFHGESILAVYERDGLNQLWFLEENLYITLEPDFDADYMDFRDAEEGERRSPEASFKCEQRLVFGN